LIPVKVYNGITGTVNAVEKRQIRLWKITKAGAARSVKLPVEKTGLDAITRWLPSGFYSTFRTFGNCTRAIGLESHLDRLYDPAAKSRIKPACARNELRKQLSLLAARYAPGEARIRISLASETQPGSIFIAIEPLKPLPDKIYEGGVKIITAQIHRKTPRLKSTDFISSSGKERASIKGSDIFEILLVRKKGITEGMTSNFFYVEGRSVGTALRSILLGITREAVIRLIRRVGLNLVYRPLLLDDIGKIDEAFITSSSRGIVPVVKIDGIPIGDGNPGPVTYLLMKRYEKYVQQHAKLISPK
jgi:branched-chain amino acid aminotransferase